MSEGVQGTIELAQGAPVQPWIPYQAPWGPGAPSSIGGPPRCNPSPNDNPPFGLTMCVVVESPGPGGGPVPGQYASVSGPALGFLIAAIAVVTVLVLVGYMSGFLRARTKSMLGKIPDLKTGDAYSRWKRERYTMLLTFFLMIVGVFFFAFGVTGNIELKIPYAELITSTPGALLIVVGYLVWTRSYRDTSSSGRAVDEGGG